MGTNKQRIHPQIAIVGGGASGLFAAVCAAIEAKKLGIKADITIYEANTRVGKKILVTGNGRCNLTNTDISADRYRGDINLFSDIYQLFDREKCLDLLRKAGLYTRTDNAGRIYPLSNQAASVLDVLRAQTLHTGVKTVTECKIGSIKKYGRGFILNSDIYADKVILAAGGKAAPVHGSDGSGFSLLSPFGINITPLYPALTAMNIRQFTKALKGIRAEGALSLRADGKTIASSSGEIQYTDYGLSGIPAMQISRFAAEAIGEGKQVTVSVDSLPMFSEPELINVLRDIQNYDPYRKAEDVLAGFMPKKLGTYLLTQASVSPCKDIGSVFDNTVEKLAHIIKKSKYTVSSVRGFTEAQVTAGGVSGDETDHHTMELKKIRGVYICGEIADVDGDCGGYNLQWAFSSGAVAGISCVKGLEKSASYK